VTDAEVEWRRKTAAAEPIREGDVFLLALIDDRARHEERIRALEKALQVAQAWLDELREEFRRGTLDDRKSRGGYLSNKNVDVEVQTRAALEPRDD
jgi:hypothetical protein